MRKTAFVYVSFEAVSNGWPGIPSSLKSFLETGSPLELTRRWPKGV
jgi:hypothetical protein